LRHDVPRLMKAMDVFVFPSLFEGLPLVLMETQAAGLPAVVADTISDEADVIKPLINRLSLQEPFSSWAKTLMAAQDIKKEISSDQALAMMEASKFNVLSSCEKLTALYDECIESNE
jgi:glycosyltransferase involved in cell wall biosynthesis